MPNTIIYERKASMTMADLEAIHEWEHCTHQESSGKYSEHSGIFEEICQEAETDDHLDTMHTTPSTRQPRRRSLSGSDELDNMPPPEIRNLHQRRHSSYESRTRSAHRETHAELKEHLDRLEDKHHLRRASFVNNLLEFNLSFEISMNSFSDNGTMHSPALAFSCPVLSYMHDEEEDSVELNLLRRPSLVSVRENSREESWESLKGHDETELPEDGHGESTEYYIELPPLEEATKPTGKRRRSHSYKMLEKRLQLESSIEVIKSFNRKENSANFYESRIFTMQHKNVDAAAVQPKTLDNDMHNTVLKRQRKKPVATRPKVAMGA